MNETQFRSEDTPSDILYIRYTADERHRRLAADAQRVRLRRWARG